MAAERAPEAVVDASAVAAILFGEPEAEALADRIEGARLVAPALLPFEVASVAWKKARRHPSQHRALRAAFNLLPRLGIEITPVEAAALPALADETGLTVYDAAYLWLARHRGAAIVTLDKQLQAAAANPPVPRR